MQLLTTQTSNQWLMAWQLRMNLMPLHCAYSVAHLSAWETGIWLKVKTKELMTLHNAKYYQTFEKIRAVAVTERTVTACSAHLC